MRSIRNQLLGYLIPGVLLIAVAAGVSLYGYMDEVLERAMDSSLAARADAIVAAVHLETDGRPRLQSSDAGVVDSRPRHDDPFYYQLFRSDGRTVTRVVPSSIGNAPLPTPHNPRHRFGDEEMADGTDVRVIRLDFTARPAEAVADVTRQTTVPAGERLTLIVAHDRRSIDETLAVLLGGLALAAAVMTAGVVFVVGVGVRRSLRPLAHVSILADQINERSLDIRFPAGDAVPLELRPISGKLNGLLDRVTAAFDREKRFSAAVAHELRTPLAELQTACEVALRWPEDTAGASAALADTLATTHDMSAMVRNLLALARGQTVTGGVEKRPVSLASFIAGLVATARPVIDRRQLTVELETSNDLSIEVDAELLKAVLSNLIENAIEHSPTGGRVRVGCTQIDDGSIVICVGNTCDTLQPDDLTHLVEPFWQKSTARSARDHYGLGLSIVDEYCKAIGAEIHFALKKDWLDAELVFRRRRSAESAELS